MLRTAVRYYYQIKFLKLVQIYARVRKRLGKPTLKSCTATPAMRAASGVWVRPALMPHDRLDDHQFVMLGEERTLSLPDDWHNRELGKKWLMELHTFNLLCGNNAHSAHDLMLDWITHNQQLDSPGWHQYMTSQRIGNWIKWSLQGNPLDTVVRTSIVQQVGYLLQVLAYDETDHKLFNNAKALLFAAYVLDDKDSDRWREKGWMLIHQYCIELLGDDGGYIGLSPMYHCSLLLDMLDIANLLQAYGETLPGYLNEAIVSARRWLTNMCHPDGNLALFNDAAFAVVAAPADLQQYAVRLGYTPVSAGPDGLLHLADSGFARMAMGPAVAMVDIGKIGPDHAASHGHADTLTFELSLKNRRIIVDTGLSTYEKMPERLLLRSTAAHNTVVLDNRNSSDVWGLFKVGRRASIIESTQTAQPDRLLVGATHDGYCRPGNRLLHRREWLMTVDKLTITDELTGRGSHRAEIFYHLHPDIAVTQLGSNRYALDSGPEGPQCELELDPALQVKTLHYDHHPAFNRAILATCLVASYQGVLPKVFISHLNWQTASALSGAHK